LLKGGVKSIVRVTVRRKTLRSFVPITSKNSASDLMLDIELVLLSLHMTTLECVPLETEVRKVKWNL
jgi:hypothetical protein